MRNDANAPLKLGVIGCGWAGQQAVHAAMAIPRIEVIALSDLEPDLIQNTLAAHPTIPCQYGPYQDLLQNADIDAVYLAVNPVMRYSMVLDAIAARKHVMVQKPHAVRADQILEFEAAAEEMGVTLQFCYFMRHFPLNRQIRARIDAGAIGEPYHGRVFLKYNTRPAPEGISRWLQVYGQKGGSWPSTPRTNSISPGGGWARPNPDGQSPQSTYSTRSMTAPKDRPKTISPAWSASRTAKPCRSTARAGSTPTCRPPSRFSAARAPYPTAKSRT